MDKDKSKFPVSFECWWAGTQYFIEWFLFAPWEFSKRRNFILFPITLFQMQYFTNFSIGSPPQELSFLLDTGSKVKKEIISLQSLRKYGYLWVREKLNTTPSTPKQFSSPKKIYLSKYNNLLLHQKCGVVWKGGGFWLFGNRSFCCFQSFCHAKRALCFPNKGPECICFLRYVVLSVRNYILLALLAFR